MNTCKSCKYWGDGQPSDKNTHNECGFISIDEPNSKDPAFIDADADDDSGMRVKFMTIATFGCALHSIKS